MNYKAELSVQSGIVTNESSKSTGVNETLITGKKERKRGENFLPNSRVVTRNLLVK